MRLSDHFELWEFTLSQTASRLGIANEPDVAQVNNIRALCRHTMEPIRARWGATYISSGFRCPAVNKAVGGAPGSQHQCLQNSAAADFVCGPLREGIGFHDFMTWLAASGIPFDQAIVEYDRWVHISLRDAAHAVWGANLVNRRQMLVKESGRPYRPWRPLGDRTLERQGGPPQKLRAWTDVGGHRGSPRVSIQTVQPEAVLCEVARI